MVLTQEQFDDANEISPYDLNEENWERIRFAMMLLEKTKDFFLQAACHREIQVALRSKGDAYDFNNRIIHEPWIFVSMKKALPNPGWDAKSNMPTDKKLANIYNKFPNTFPKIKPKTYSQTEWIEDELESYESVTTKSTQTDNEPIHQKVVPNKITLKEPMSRIKEVKKELVFPEWEEYKKMQTKETLAAIYEDLHSEYEVVEASPCPAVPTMEMSTQTDIEIIHHENQPKNIAQEPTDANEIAIKMLLESLASEAKILSDLVIDAVKTTQGSVTPSQFDNDREALQRKIAMTKKIIRNHKLSMKNFGEKLVGVIRQEFQRDLQVNRDREARHLIRTINDDFSNNQRNSSRSRSRSPISHVKLERCGRNWCINENQNILRITV